MKAQGDAASSAWAPLTIPAFRWIWIATIVSYTGSAMQVVGATWLMVKLDNHPLMIALLQAASSLPMFVAGLPAGVLADIVDRRWLLIVANVWMVTAALMLFVAVSLDWMTVPVLLGLTCAMGLGAAVNAPAFQAIVPELAPGPLLVPAISLNSAGSNVAKTIGPALGGILIGLMSIGPVFALNALSTLAVVVALVAWQRQPVLRRLPPEHFFSALRSGLRYVSVVPPVRAILWRSLLFFFPASALWALLPSIAAGRLHFDAMGYGGLLGALGVGAVLAAMAQPSLRQRWHADLLAASATAACSIAAISVALSTSAAVAMLGAAFFGAGWLVNLTLLNVSIQLAVEGWIKARMLSLFIVTYMGAMTLGSVGWGYVAEWTSAWVALSAAGLLQLASIVVAKGLPLNLIGDTDFTPANGLDTALFLDHDNELGTLLVTIDYRVSPENLDAFSETLTKVKPARLRKGAISWRHWRSQDDSRQRESYIVESHREYLRQQLRRTQADENLERELLDLVESGTVPQQNIFLERAPRGTRT